MTPSERFHIALHARPATVVPGPARSLDGRTCRTLQIAPGELQIPMARTFEEASRSLAALPRLFIEPDGSSTRSVGGAIRQGSRTSLTLRVTVVPKSP